ncbi:class I SAM-dependent methyltransferase [Polyangium sp. y55x31]|uniref:class I SAM-dependent methyltransferase n=1 Tax=Polyangium sp. y55x31 TaxID=3042688 RepID=UPI002482D7DF|nr:class I SAM-dependent methyltransferase [Polyangium sp. y55x31]MDI1479454.1 class I SAM-dependent methyltransferase [Polyangium sp. y55x31]
MPDHVAKNQEYWNRIASEYQTQHAEQLGIVEPTWGVWGIPERDLRILGDVAGKDVLEFGCGGAQWSVALARRGARMTALDFSAEQLRHARALVEREGVSVTLVQGSAEAVPLPDASFDLVFCDHGAMTFANPHKAVPEAARLLRPGGMFIFNMATPLLYLVVDKATDLVVPALVNDYFGMKPWEDADGATTFQLSYGEWIRLFRRSGFVVEDLVEIRPPEDAKTTYEGYAPLEWARKYPAEHVWKVRREALR